MSKRKNIEQMSDEERAAYKAKLIEELRGHVDKSGMTRREQLERMTYEERQRYIKKLQDEILAMLGAPVKPEEPEPPVTPKRKGKGKRGKRRLERFDALPDDEQIDELKGLWGGEVEP